MLKVFGTVGILLPFQTEVDLRLKVLFFSTDLWVYIPHTFVLHYFTQSVGEGIGRKDVSRFPTPNINYSTGNPRT
jgi:hypothetical protein